MNELKKTPKWLALLTAILVPYFLLMFSIRIMTTPLFARFEYQLPNFPIDSYGFNQEERLEYAIYGIKYLTNTAGIEYLGDLTFEDGEPLFIDRELSHMVDVKKLYTSALNVWYGITLLLGLAAIWTKQTGRWFGFRSALSLGGWATLGLILMGGLLLAIDFDWLFTQFHHLFFTGDTWLFYTSDTLIRLYPMPFWRDAFIAVFGFTILGAGLLIWQGNPSKTKKA